jgi:hypothetical protein
MMIGDRKVVKIEQLIKLDNIAALSAILLLETTLYVGLSAMVELYISTPSDENFNKMAAALQECTSRYPDFSRAQDHQIMQLMSSGHLRGTVHSHSESSTPTEPVVPKSTDGITPLFGKDTGNIPPKLPAENTSKSNNIIQLFPKKK